MVHRSDAISNGVAERGAMFNLIFRVFAVSLSVLLADSVAGQAAQNADPPEWQRYNLHPVPDTASNNGQSLDEKAAASPANKQFVEIDRQNEHTVFDLRTVRMILPYKFSIVSTDIDNPDVLRLRLKVHDTLKTYCTRPDGEYEAPAELFTLGKPDMPVSKIRVAAENKKHSTVTWVFPYRRFEYTVDRKSRIYCGNPRGINDLIRNEIRSGLTVRMTYDCGRALTGNDNGSIMSPVQRGTLGEEDYAFICNKVTGREPYLPP